ncbi:acyltransferase [Hufsiella ginkgonis]|uniref:Acyltransferase n=1 Tax=Hufsiella ginkgonis TaxID=2695274 RepID=A0A7K1Y289_9SPHI|nr:acyltransferase [Hufsiella ginkgonis]MXV17394.1 acyltransferase [Hufsiella ginkgonis]
MKKSVALALYPFKLISGLLGFIFSFLESRQSYVFLGEMRKAFYGAMYSARLKHLGTNPWISRKMTLSGGEYISVGDNFMCLGNLRIGAYSKHNKSTFNPTIVIGNGVSINFYCHISCINKIIIGDNVLMASKIFITDHYHGEIDERAIKISPSLRELVSKGPVIIENNVWIGEGVVILPGVTIGENSIIGANSVVTKSFPRNSVIGGIPAKVIRQL